MNIAIHHGDADIKAMLMENSITLERDSDANDVAITTVRDEKSKHVWLVLRFYHPGDSGYAAYGVPDSTPLAEIREVFAMVLSQYDGKPFTAYEMPPLFHN